MLLTSGQISMTISSIIVFIFTSLLFLSGYILQQQTVRGIQIALHPPPPQPSASASSTASLVPRPFGTPPLTIEDPSTPFVELRPIDWKKAAYVQLVRNHLHVCNAVMLFAALAAQQSSARRVLLYPKIWDQGALDGRTGSKTSRTSSRLLRAAARRYKVELMPIEPMLESSDMEKEAELGYPLAGLLSLSLFDRLIHIAPSGLILNSAPLDSLFGLPMTAAVGSITGTEKSCPITIINPSMEAYRKSMSSLTSNPLSDWNSMQELSEKINVPTPQVFSQTSELDTANGDFNATVFLTETAYVQLADPGIPGPEFDVPRAVFLQARPQHVEPREAWEAVYEQYRMSRMEVCGLDLEPMMARKDSVVETTG